MPFYVILSCLSIHVQQRSINRALLGLICKMKISPKNSHFSCRFYRKFVQFNTRILSVCRDQNQNAHFWSSYISIMFFSIIFIQCHLIYVFLFVDLPNFFIKLVFLQMAIEMSSLQFMLIHKCAKVVKWNQRTLKMKCAFQINFGDTCHRHRIPVSFLLKVESLQNAKLLHCYAYRMFGNNRITSKTFYLVGCINRITLTIIYAILDVFLH